MTSEKQLIRARSLGRVFGAGEAARKAVDDVSLSVHAGEVLLVFGPSGCGKSTLLAMLGGLDRAYTGELELFGKNVASLGDRELSALRGDKIGFVFQAFHLLGHQSVLDNVLAPSLFSSRRQSHEAIEQRGVECLKRVGLADRALAVPGELSGGQRQRVAIARALLHQPELLLCDEPTGNLDRKTGEQIIDLFAALHQDFGTTIVIVTHEDRMTRLAHRTLHMLDGRVSEGDDPARSP